MMGNNECSYVPSVPQSILLGLQSKNTTKEKKQRKLPIFPKMVKVK